MSRSDDWRIGADLQRVRDEEARDRNWPPVYDDAPSRQEAESLDCPVCGGDGWLGRPCPKCGEWR